MSRARPLPDQLGAAGDADPPDHADVARLRRENADLRERLRRRTAGTTTSPGCLCTPGPACGYGLCPRRAAATGG